MSLFALPCICLAPEKVHRRRVQGVPPPLKWPEEQSLSPGDILVTVEHCAACARHRMSLHHKAEAYM